VLDGQGLLKIDRIKRFLRDASAIGDVKPHALIMQFLSLQTGRLFVYDVIKNYLRYARRKVWKFFFKRIPQRFLRIIKGRGGLLKAEAVELQIAQEATD